MIITFSSIGKSFYFIHFTQQTLTRKSNMAKKCSELFKLVNVKRNVQLIYKNLYFNDILTSSFKYGLKKMSESMNFHGILAQHNITVKWLICYWWAILLLQVGSTANKSKHTHTHITLSVFQNERRKSRYLVRYCCCCFFVVFFSLNANLYAYSACSKLCVCERGRDRNSRDCTQCDRVSFHSYKWTKMG